MFNRINAALVISGISLATPSVAQTLICQQLPDGAIYCPRPAQPQMVVVQAPQPVMLPQQPVPVVTRRIKEPPPPSYAPDPAILSPLPDLDLPLDAGPQEYLQVAHAAIIDRWADKAQAALEAAETRILTRSVPHGATERPITSHLTHLIDTALLELRAGHWGECDDLVLRALRG